MKDRAHESERSSKDVTCGGEYKARIYSRYLSSSGSGSGATPTTVESHDRSMAAYYRAKLSRWLPADLASSILDLGCGQGGLLRFLMDRGYRDVTGVDCSPEQAAAARARALGARICEMDFFDFLGTGEPCYDCVVALDVIEHLEKERVLDFLDAIHRVLKPGGRLILQTPNAASPWGMAVRYGDFTHECCFTPKSLSQLLVLTGFSDVECQPAGPAALSFVGALRLVLWKMLSWLQAFYNLVETGTACDGIYTRVFQCCCRKA